MPAQLPPDGILAGPEPGGRRLVDHRDRRRRRDVALVEQPAPEQRDVERLEEARCGDAMPRRAPVIAVVDWSMVPLGSPPSSGADSATPTDSTPGNAATRSIALPQNAFSAASDE